MCVMSHIPVTQIWRFGLLDRVSIDIYHLVQILCDHFRYLCINMCINIYHIQNCICLYIWRFGLLDRVSIDIHHLVQILCDHFRYLHSYSFVYMCGNIYHIQNCICMYICRFGLLDRVSIDNYHLVQILCDHFRYLCIKSVLIYIICESVCVCIHVDLACSTRCRLMSITLFRFFVTTFVTCVYIHLYVCVLTYINLYVYAFV